MWRYELFQDQAGQWRWHLRAGNGRLVATSGEAFYSQYDAERAMMSVRANGGTARLPVPYAAQVLAGILARAKRRDAAERAAAVGGLFGPR